MANIDNLRSFAVLSTSELREIQSRGGKNSGSARRQRKELRQLTTDLMLSDAVPAYRDVVRQLCPGLNDDTNLAVIVARLFDVAMVGKSSDAILAARLLMEWAGFTPENRIQQEATARASEATEEKETQVIFYSVSERENPLRKEEENEEKYL
ncbi:MAG: hypothetical protein IJG40_16070 [Oscillospiraceae bacterium]|nr:hypothetical protein [Oscillospiraceae bacterium]